MKKYLLATLILAVVVGCQPDNFKIPEGPDNPPTDVTPGDDTPGEDTPGVDTPVIEETQPLELQAAAPSGDLFAWAMSDTVSLFCGDTLLGMKIKPESFSLNNVCLSSDT